MSKTVHQTKTVLSNNDMTQKTQKTARNIGIILFTAVISVSAARMFSPFDQIKENEKVNIEQSKDIEILFENDEDLEIDVKYGFELIRKSQEMYFDILNDKIDNSKK